MTSMSILINLIGIALIIFILWWFLFSKQTAKKITNNKITIRVHNGVYEPSIITAKVNQHLSLEFIRDDESPCAEYVIFNALGKSAQLPLHDPTTIDLTVEKPGKYQFTCQMGMYKGQLIIK